MTTKTIQVPSALSSKTYQSKNKVYPIKTIFWVGAIVLGALQAWANRYTISSEDGISYLDIADAYLRGEWNLAINPHWSPLYSWLIGLALYILKPNPYWEFGVVKLVNFVIYLFSLLCFDFFLRNLISYYNQKNSIVSIYNYLKIPKWIWLVSGYTLFLWSSLKWLGIHCDTPDILTAAFVYLAAGIVLRINIQSATWFNFIALGIVLGLGYLSKTVMFPVAFVFLGVAMFSTGNFRSLIKQTIAALLVFVVITTPFITAISTAKGRITIGEAGRLSYAWYISPRVADHHWQGEPPGSGTPKHPTRQIFSQPKVFEFATPINTTYPVWYDPSYWNDGLKAKFDLIKQIKTIVKNVIYYQKQFLGILLFVYLILICVRGDFLLSIKNLAENWMLLLPALAGLGIFMLTTDMAFLVLEAQKSTRYIAPFVVLLFAAVFSSMRFRDSIIVKRLIVGMTIATFVISSILLSFQGSKDFITVFKEPKHIDWQVASSLHQLGVESGAKVANLGKADYFWARLARFKIVAEIPDPINFWSKDDVVKANALEAVAKTGAKVIVHKPQLELPNSSSTVGWRKLGNTEFYAYLLQK